MDRFAAAAFAPLIMYAWDMCDAGLRKPSPVVDPRIAGNGQKVVGYLSAGDDIFAAGDSIRTKSIGAGDRVWYGYVAIRNDTIVVVIRGTDGAQEWADDVVFLMQNHPTINEPGLLVDRGFFSIYSTMQFHPVGSDASVASLADGVPVVSGLRDVIGKNKVMVLGHSLGAAIATYLTLDLTLAGISAKACLFASPRTGNQGFVDFFDSKVTSANYDLFNYERDLVPMVPVCDILHLSRYRTLPQAKLIPAAYSNATVCNDPPCNHHLICYTALLDPSVYQREMANANVAQDDRNCAKCVVSPLVGDGLSSPNPTLDKAPGDQSGLQ